MLRSLCCACLALLLCGVVVLAGEFQGRIMKVDAEKNTVLFQQYDKKEKVGDPVEVNVKDAKFFKGTFDKETKKVKYEPVDAGLKADAFSKIDPEKGARVTIVAEGDKLTKDSKVTEVKLGGGRKGQ
jgi:hypothetical protein